MRGGLSAVGRANAARVSYGSEHDTWSGLRGAARRPARHPTEHITITVVLYNVVAGGVPSEGDVAAAVDDLEALYAACKAGARVHVPYANAPMTPHVPKSVPISPTPTVTNPFMPKPMPAPPDVTNGSSFPEPLPPPLPAGAVPIAPFADVLSPKAAFSSLPLTYASFLYVHELARALLAKPAATRGELSEAFALFRFANEIHTQCTIAPSPTALYNLACCASRMASLMQQAPLAAPFAPLEPPIGVLGRQTAEQCLDAGVAWLRAAAAAGYAEHQHMQIDGDLVALRTQRAPKFHTALQLAQAVAAGA